MKNIIFNELWTHIDEIQEKKNMFLGKGLFCDRFEAKHMIWKCCFFILLLYIIAFALNLCQSSLSSVQSEWIFGVYLFFSLTQIIYIDL